MSDRETIWRQRLQRDKREALRKSLATAIEAATAAGVLPSEVRAELFALVGGEPRLWTVYGTCPLEGRDRKKRVRRLAVVAPSRSEAERIFREEERLYKFETVEVQALPEDHAPTVYMSTYLEAP